MQKQNLSYDEVHAYVGNYRNGHGEGVPYDVNGVIHLMLAALDNLRQQWIDPDLEDIASSATAEQREMLIKIGRFLESSIPGDEG